MNAQSSTALGLGRAAFALLLAGAAATAPASAATVSEGDGRTFFVSSRGSDSNSCSASAPCATIGRAVSLAETGDTVLVAKGEYHEDVLISVGLTLRGAGQPTIDATGLANGVVIRGEAAAGAKVSGFTIENATFEGILVQQTRDITIEHNTVRSNDQGIFLPPEQQTGECAAHGPIPGDCGEGLHLWSVTGAKVANNRIANNSGGILLTDESGPTAFNLLFENTVVDNQYDCGITIAGHNPAAAPGGVPNPDAGGIYSNVVSHNHADRNGVAGQGAGILLAGAGPGTAVYNNLILDNEASGNGLAGLTLHSHTPGQDLNGNVIVGNQFSHDNLDGDFDFAPATDSETTGIFLASAAPLTGTVVKNNVIRDVHFGIWTLNVPPIPVNANHFASDVAVPVFQQ